MTIVTQKLLQGRLFEESVKLYRGLSSSRHQKLRDFSNQG